MCFSKRLFIHFIFVCCSVLSCVSLAFEDDGHWTEGYYWKIKNKASYNDHAPTPTLLCQQKSSYVLHVSGITGYCQNALNFERYQCTGSQISSAQCGVSPPPDCPPDGDIVRLAQVINGSYVNGEFIPDSLMDGVINIGNAISADGCKFVPSIGDPDFNADQNCVKFDSMAIICYQNYISTAEAFDVPDGQGQAVIKENLTAVNENEGSQNTVKDTSNSNVADPVVVTDPDGSVITTEQTTEVDTVSSGSVIEQTEEVVFISETDGIIKNKVTTTTTTELPDGTKQVTTETTTQYTQSPITNYTIDNSSGSITINTTQGSNASVTETATDSFDATGNKISSQSETSGDLDSKDDQAKEDGCEENPNLAGCINFSDQANKGSFDISSLQSSQDIQWQNITTQINSIKEELETVLSIGDLNGSGSLGCYEFFSYGNETFEMCLSQYESAFNIIGSALFFIVLISAAVMILRD